MNILLLGGTRFLGRFIAEAALQNGHEVTLFNRGKENPELFPQAEKLIGDRDGNLEALEGRTWDAVIDTCGFAPTAVRESAELLAASGHYTFISSVSVYAELAHEGIDEEHSVSRLAPEEEKELAQNAVNAAGHEYYGELKFLCEQEVTRIFPEQSLIIRPGLIVGPYDFTGRFSYWVNRIERGGDVLAPGRRDKQIQFIDVRDLAEWIVRMIQAKACGTYNATGPDWKLTMEQFLTACQAELNNEANLVWAEESFLLERDVKFWTELPLWVPDNQNMAGFLSVDIERALGAGLAFRPLSETIRDTWTWEAERPNAGEKAGLNPEKEQRILELWLKQNR